MGRPAKQRRASSAHHETIKGELLAFSVRGSDGFWGFGRLRTGADGGDAAIVGKLLGANEGDTLELTGEWTDHPKFGRQFKFVSAQVVLASDTAGVVAWLASNIPQVSRRRAETMVEALGVQGVWDALESGDIAALARFDGITEERAQAAISAYAEKRSSRDEMVALKGFGLTDGQIAQLKKVWKERVLEKLRANPYGTIEHVRGFGWKRADELARRMGVPTDSPARIAAGVLHTLNESVGAGHCYVSSGKLVALVAGKVCNVDESTVWPALRLLEQHGKVVLRGSAVYLPNIERAESTVAAAIAGRVAAMKGAA